MRSFFATSLALLTLTANQPASAQPDPRAATLAPMRVRGERLAQLGIQKRLHPFVIQMYETWCNNIREDNGHLTSSVPTERKIRELEGGKRWYESNKHQLVQHPDYAKTLPEFQRLMYSLAQLKAQRAVEFAQQGVAEKNPNIFSGSSGLDQQLKEAELIVSATQAEAGSASSEAQAATEAIAKARAECDRLAGQYKKQAAASFKLPSEAYRGSDKSKLRQMVLAKWRELYPADHVLGVRFVDSAWERKRSSNYNNGTWYHYDNSALRAYVVIKKDAELGEVYPVYINRDNSNGRLVVGAETKGSSYSHAEILLKNVRF